MLAPAKVCRAASSPVQPAWRASNTQPQPMPAAPWASTRRRRSPARPHRPRLARMRQRPFGPGSWRYRAGHLAPLSLRGHVGQMSFQGLPASRPHKGPGRWNEHINRCSIHQYQCIYPPLDGQSAAQGDPWMPAPRHRTGRRTRLGVGSTRYGTRSSPSTAMSQNTGDNGAWSATGSPSSSQTVCLRFDRSRPL